MDQLLQIFQKPGLIPVYLFVFFMLGLIGWEAIKLIALALGFKRDTKPPKQTKK